jgi:hypothetical protein
MEPFGKCPVAAGDLNGQGLFFRQRAPLGKGYRKMDIESGVNRRLPADRLVDGCRRVAGSAQVEGVKVPLSAAGSGKADHLVVKTSVDYHRRPIVLLAHLLCKIFQ